MKRASKEAYASFNKHFEAFERGEIVIDHHDDSVKYKGTVVQLANDLNEGKIIPALFITSYKETMTIFSALVDNVLRPTSPDGKWRMVDAQKARTRRKFCQTYDYLAQHYGSPKK